MGVRLVHGQEISLISKRPVTSKPRQNTGYDFQHSGVTYTRVITVRVSTTERSARRNFMASHYSRVLAGVSRFGRNFNAADLFCTHPQLPCTPLWVWRLKKSSAHPTGAFHLRVRLARRSSEVAPHGPWAGVGAKSAVLAQWASRTSKSNALKLCSACQSCTVPFYTSSRRRTSFCGHVI